MTVGPAGAPARPALRRGPALLAVAALLVLIVAALGARGVISAPSAGAVPPAGTTGAKGAVVGKSTAPTPAPTTPSATPTTTASTTPSGAQPSAGEAGGAGADAPGSVGTLTGTDDDAAMAMAAAGTAFAAALGTFFDALAEPAQDSATPDPIDSAHIAPPVTPTPDDEVLPADSGEGRRLVYAITAQRVWFVEADGTVSRTYRVSGRLDRPQPGTYEVYSKSRTAISYDYKETMEYMVRFAHGQTAAIGFHDIPRDKAGNEVQTLAQLGEPISAGCVRQADPDAIALWNWAPVGTTVVVVA